MSRMPISSSSRRLCLLALLAAIPPLGDAAAQERYTLGGAEVAIYNPAGEVEVVPGGPGGVVIDVTRAGADAPRLRVSAERIRERYALVVRVPGESLVYPGLSGESVLRVRPDGTFGDGDAGGAALRVSGRGRGVEARAHLRVQVPDGVRLEVFSGAGRVRIASPRADVRVYSVVSDVEAVLAGRAFSARTGGGAVRVSGAAADVEVQTVVGDVDLTGVRTPGVVNVRTGGGSVHVDGVFAQALRVEATVGAVTLSALSVPAVTATSGGGRIRVSGFAGVRTLQLRSTTENVEIAVPRDASASFTLRTTVGRLEVSAPLRDVQRTASQLTGRMGSGATRIDASSASGTICLHTP
jgi:Putative adhesin